MRYSHLLGQKIARKTTSMVRKIFAPNSGHINAGEASVYMIILSIRFVVTFTNTCSEKDFSSVVLRLGIDSKINVLTPITAHIVIKTA